MEKVYVKTAELLTAIFLGYALKRSGHLSPQDTQTISKLVLWITLPCVIVKSLSGITLGQELAFAAAIGAAANGALLLMTWLCFGRRDSQGWMAALFSMTTFNISSFAVPVLAPFISAETMAGVLAFNLPTSIFTYAIVPSCAALRSETSEHSWRQAGKKLLHSTPTMTCLVMFALAALHISLPQAVVAIAGSFAGANTFLAMLAVGSLMSFSFSNEGLQLLPPITARLGTVCVLAVLIRLLPIRSDLCSALIMSVFAPAASTMPVLALQSGYRGGSVAVTNSVYLLISVAVLSVLSTVLY